MVAQELVTVDDSQPPPIETEETSTSTGEPYEYYQPRDTIPEPGTELLFTHQGPIPQNRQRTPTPSQPSSSPPHGSKSSLGGIVVVLDRIDLERESVGTEKTETFIKEEPIDVDEEEERVETERQRERAEKEREKEKAEKEREKERLLKEKEKERLEKEKEQREREQKERDRHERQERHNLNLVNLSTSLPASPRSPSVRADKKVHTPEPASSKHGGHSKHQRAAPEPIKATAGLASTLLTATAAIAGKKSKHINLNSDDDEDDDDDEELMDI